MIVPCECGAKLKIDEAKIGGRAVKIRCPRCGAIQQVATPAPQPAPAAVAPPARTGPRCESVILVAHESEATRDMLRGVLAEAGFGVEDAADGFEALKKATELRPQAVLLDVGLPGIYGFELCERLKEDSQTKDVKILLLSSSYDTARYRRPPISLYGADDYIEKYEISDSLAFKIHRLLTPEQPAAGEKTAAPPAPGSAAAQDSPGKEPAPPVPDLATKKGPREKEPEPEFSPESLLKEEPGQPAFQPSTPGAQPGPQEAKTGMDTSSWFDTFVHQAQDGAAMAPDSFTLESSIFQKKESDIPSVDEEDPEAVEKAKRLARIIVSDVALYNPETVIEGVKNGTFYELLKNDIDEGRELYEKRVSPSIRAKKDYYQEAFNNFIEAQKKIVR